MVLDEVANQFMKRKSLTLEEFEVYVGAAINKVKKGIDEEEWNNSFILGSVRIVDHKFADKHLVLIRKLDDPRHVLAAAIGDGTKEMSPLEEGIRWDDISKVQNEIIKNFAHVFYSLESCGGPIEMMTLSLEEKNGSIVLNEDHILQLAEKLCDERGIIMYQVPDKFYVRDDRGKFLKDRDGNYVKKQDATISSTKKQESTDDMLNFN